MIPRTPHGASPVCQRHPAHDNRPAVPPSVFVRLARWCMTHRWQTFVAWVLALVAAFVDRPRRRHARHRELPAARHGVPGAPTTCSPAHAPKANGAAPTSSSTSRREGTLRDGAGARADARPSLARVRARHDRRRRRPTRSPRAASSRPTGASASSTITYKDEFQALQAARTSSACRTRPSARAAPELQRRARRPGRASSCASPSRAAAREFIGFLAAALILLFFFGSAIAAGVPLLTAVLALGTTLGLVPVISHARRHAGLRRPARRADRHRASGSTTR